MSRMRGNTKDNILDAVRDAGEEGLTIHELCSVVGPCRYHSRRGVQIGRATHEMVKDGKLRRRPQLSGGSRYVEAGG